MLSHLNEGVKSCLRRDKISRMKPKPITKSQALAVWGSGAKLAAALGISRAAVSQWAENIPEPRATQVDLITRLEAKRQAARLRRVQKRGKGNGRQLQAA